METGINQLETYRGGPLDGKPVSAGTVYSQHQDKPGRRDEKGRTLFVTYARVDGRMEFQGYLRRNHGRQEKAPDPKSPFESPALRMQSRFYPAWWNGLVPAVVRVVRNVAPGLAWVWFTDEELEEMPIPAGSIVAVYVNSHGAVTALWGRYQIGLVPDEFEVVQWHAQFGTDVERWEGEGGAVL